MTFVESQKVEKCDNGDFLECSQLISKFDSDVIRTFNMGVEKVHRCKQKHEFSKNENFMCKTKHSIIKIMLMLLCIMLSCELMDAG